MHTNAQEDETQFDTSLNHYSELMFNWSIFHHNHRLDCWRLHRF